MCLFCKIIKGEIGCYQVAEDDHCLAFLDISQATPGHCLVIPKKHCQSLLDADQETINAVNQMSQTVALKLMDKLGATGINIASNAGAVAGQSIFHYHVHVIPRYREDDNYRPRFINTEPTKAQLQAILSQITMS